MYLPRIRRINDVIKEIKEFDPDTIINWKILKTLCERNEITCMKYGNSWAINIDELYGYLKGEKFNGD